MKRGILILFLIFLIKTTAFSQKSVFDIAKFYPPSGWAKDETPERLTFTKIDNNKGTYCVLGLYKSIQGSGNLETDFSSDWQNLLTKTLSITEKPVRMQGGKINGYDVMRGAARYMRDNSNGYALLISMENNAKLMSIVVMTTDTTNLAEIRKFFDGLELEGGNDKTGNSNTTIIEPGASSFGNYIYSVPSGWKSENNGSSIVLRGPDNSSVITILPMVKAGGDLDDDMEALFFQVFPGWVADPRIPDHHKLTKGTSPSGWQYYKKEIAITRSDNRDAEIYAFVFLARVGDLDAIIAGSYINGSDLLDDEFKTDWIVFYHSLDFRNYKGSSFDLSKEIIGRWSAGGSSGMSSDEFRPDGKYVSAAGFSTSHAIDNYTERVSTTAFSGDGTYSVNGNILSMISGKTGKERKTKIRLYYRNDYGSWILKLGILDVSVVDGSLYEVGMVKQN